MGQADFKNKLAIALDYQGEDDYNEATFSNLMESARIELPAYAEEALQVATEDIYAALRDDIEYSQLFEATFPEANFELVLKVIRDPRFLKTGNGWWLMMMFDMEWEKVTESQRVLLLEALSAIYEKFEAWMPCFSISELVGENFDSLSCYQFFNQFATSSNETARAFVPHGYEHALRNSNDHELTVTLWKAIIGMEGDLSEKIRGEVEESLSRLANRGLKRPKDL